MKDMKHMKSERAQTSGETLGVIREGARESCGNDQIPSRILKNSLSPRLLKKVQMQGGTRRAE